MGRADGTDRRVTSTPVDDTGATILHVDMDAFFAAVELLDRPELRGRPAVVGRATGRSVVSSATYEARRFGVHSAMPMAQALRLCPSAVVLEPHMERYREVSRRVMAIFREVTPLVEQVSVDEAFLDVSGAGRMLGSPARIGRLLRERVRAETGLACSVGAAGVKFVAKLASGRAKPDGMLVIPPAATLDYLRPLPVSAIWGVGPSTAEALRRRGLATVGDLAETPEHLLHRWLGEAVGTRLAELSHGIDRRPVTPRAGEKSVGHEITFEQDVTDRAALHREILRLAGQTATRLRAAGLAGRTVGLKLRFDDFRTLSRSRTLSEATNVGRRIHAEAVTILDALGETPPVRLIGVRMENLEPAGGSAALWDPDDDWRGAEHAMDSITARFGGGAVAPASLVGTRPRRVGDTSSVRGTPSVPNPRGDG